MQRIQRRWLWFALAIVAVALLMLLSTLSPQNPVLASGSTYTRQPAGYAAWFAYMEERGTPVQRWQRPLEEWIEPQATPDGELAKKSSDTLDPNPRVLLQIFPNVVPRGISYREREWVARGNTLFVLGLLEDVTEAPFRSELESDRGPVVIETRRRFPDSRKASPPDSADSSSNAPDDSSEATPSELDIEPYPGTTLLGDRYGAVVSQQTIGNGRVIYAITPHLAANAYQDESGNFEFLADVVARWEQPIWVDEYLHGYKDEDVIFAEEGSWLAYLAKTPLAIAFCQAAIAFVIILGAKNRRLGPPLADSPATLDNSTAYINAMASVLQKADHSDFVIANVGKAERARLQRALGLGRTPVGDRELIEAWAQHTGRSSRDVESVLNGIQQQNLSENQLADWLRAAASVRQYMPD